MKTSSTQVRQLCPKQMQFAEWGELEKQRQFVNIYRHKTFYTNIIWINAESYSEARTCFLSLARRLNIHTPMLNENALEYKLLVEHIYSVLTGPTLIVFDNVQHEEDDEQDIRVFFPKTVSDSKVQWAIILTTREKVWHGTRTIDISGLNAEECYELLIVSLQISRSDENRRSALEIQTMCEGLPVVIQQVIAVIKIQKRLRQMSSQQEYSLDDYVKFVNLNLDKIIKTKPEDPPVGKSVFTIFQLTFKRIVNLKYGKLALYCLDVMSLLNPENVPVALLEQLLDRIREYNIKMSILILIDYNLITQVNQTLKVHRMIQEVRKLSKTFLAGIDSGFNNVDKIIGDPLQIVLRSFTDVLEKSAFENANVHHILNNGLRLLENLNTNMPNEVISCHEFAHALAEKLTEVGRYNEAMKSYEFTLRERETVLGQHHPETLLTKHKLASVYHNQCNYHKAAELYETVLRQRENVLGEDHLDTLRSMHNLALVKQDQGELDKAKDILTHVTQKQDRLLGKRNAESLRTKHNLALVYQKQGKYLVSEKTYQFVLHEQQNLVGANLRDTLSTEHNLASLYYIQAKHDKAEKMFRSVLRKQENHFGGNHPDTLLTKHNLASVCRALGKLDEAEHIYVSVLQEQEKLFGKKHPDTLLTKQNLDLVHRDEFEALISKQREIERKKIAEEMLRKAKERQEAEIRLSICAGSARSARSRQQPCRAV